MMAHELVERQARNIQGLKEGGDALVREPLELVTARPAKKVILF